MKFLIFMIIFIQILNADLLQEQQKSFKKAYKNLTKSIGQLYIDDKNLNLNPKCDINWQQTFCKGDMMCYSTKCFYAIESKDLYAVILSEHIIYLEQTDINSLKEVMPRIKSMIDFGLPLDNMKHDFSFRDSNNFLCKYWVWRKNKKITEVNLTGCNKGVNILYTFNNELSGKGIIEVYTILDSKVD